MPKTDHVVHMLGKLWVKCIFHGSVDTIFFFYKWVVVLSLPAKCQFGNQHLLKIVIFVRIIETMILAHSLIYTMLNCLVLHQMFGLGRDHYRVFFISRYSQSLFFSVKFSVSHFQCLKFSVSNFSFYFLWAFSDIILLVQDPHVAQQKTII